MSRVTYQLQFDLYTDQPQIPILTITN